MRRLAIILAVSACVTAQSQIEHEHDEDRQVPSAENMLPGKERADRIYEMYDYQLADRADRAYHNGQYWEVISLLTLRHGVNPNDAGINGDLVYYLRSSGRYDLALTQAIKFRQSHQKDEFAALTEATIYSQYKLWDRIPGILEPVLPLANHVNSFVMLMKSYEEIGLIKEAIRVVEARLRRFPDDRSAKQNYDRLTARLKGN
jgi:tetratricopeptide (TPR) repeat protein